MSTDKWVKGGAAALGSVFQYLLGGFTPLYGTLLLFQGLDILSGAGGAFLHGDWTSKKSTFGFFKKTGQWICIIVAKHIETNFFHSIAPLNMWGMELSLLSAVITYFILTEALSLVENSKTLGTDIPDFIPNFVKNGLAIFNENAFQKSNVGDNPKKEDVPMTEEDEQPKEITENNIQK